MHNNRPWLTAARGWVVLDRHDEPTPTDPPADPEPTPDPEPVEDPAPEPDPKPAPPKGKDAETEKWKALARKHEAEAKKNAAAAAKLAEIDAANLSETERLTAAKDAAEAKAEAATKRAVLAEVKALASEDFADPTDAEYGINPADFLDADGDIDVEALKAKLAETLEAKPHWRKPAAAPGKPPGPKPDPGQGARGGDGKTDFRSVSKEDYAAEMAKLGLKTYS